MSVCLAQGSMGGLAGGLEHLPWGAQALSFVCNLKQAENLSRYIMVIASPVPYVGNKCFFNQLGDQGKELSVC